MWRGSGLVGPEAPLLPNLSGPALYMDFFGQMLAYAVFPHKSQHHMAFGSEIGAKDQAWGWICEQIAEFALHPEWNRRESIDRLDALSAELFHEIGDCRLPICIGPAVATQLFSFWNAITALRIQKNGWAMASSDPALEEHFEIASRNVRRARVRSSLEKYRGQIGWDTISRDASRDVFNEPSDDKLPPNVSDDLLLAQDPSPVLDPSWHVSPNPNTPSGRPKPLAHSVDSGRKSARIDHASTSKGDQDFATPHAMTNPMYIIIVSDEQVKLAKREPAKGWSTYSVLYPDEAPTKVILDPVFNPKTFWNENPNEGWIAGSALDPLTEALEVARAKRVDPGEFRTLSEDASLLRLFVGRDFQVWELPARKTRDGKTRHNRRRRARLGAAVS